ncbi:OmpH family outer membrane protein [bacterium]|nr:OmpH family outer membrane protein [bacterium]
MKKYVKTIVVTAFAFGLGFGISNFAMSDTQPETNIAVVDVAKLIESSDKVKALKSEQAKNMEDLTKLAQNAKADIEKQSTEDNKEKLAKKYQETINQRRQTNAENYAKKLAVIDKDVDNLVKKKAQSSNYSLILAKSSVLYGGEDITDELAKEINKK